MSSPLLADDDLPPGFTYPREFLRLVDIGLFEIEPWWILTGDLLRGLQRGLRERYSSRNLVLFAKRTDNDDCACWDLDSGRVSIIHDFASPGWEQRRDFEDFSKWLHAAVDDMLEF